MTPMHSLLARLSLAFLLLFAQHEALAHQALHARDDARPAQAQEHKQFHSSLCDFHGTFDELMGVAGASAPVVPLASANTCERAAERYFSALPTELLVPASRGPPLSSLA